MSTEDSKAILHRAAQHFSNPDTRAAYLELYDAHAVVHGYQGVEPGIENITEFYRAL